MKVKILVEFEVLDIGDDGAAADVAVSAASLAAHHYLAFCEVSGHGTDVDVVTVHVDGYGPCKVRLGTEHE